MELEMFKTTEVLNWNIFVYGSPEEPLFLAKDVAEWIDHSQASKMIESIDEDEKLIGTLFLSGQNREVWMLTENGLYEVLMQSRKPIAKDFKRAIKNILKEIRTKGGYIASSPEDSPELIMAKALQVAAHTIENNKQKIKQLEVVNEIQTEQLKKAQPLIQLASDCYVSTVTMTASIISARLGFKSANAFNKRLKDLGVQYKIKGDDCWKLTSRYSCKGYTKTIPFPYPKQDGTIGTRNRMEWTESGFVFLRDFLTLKEKAETRTI